ncbi:MAG: hypothetical protein SVR94_03695 [Pseudomonadota bacterium]|nr:hypothetical protein [Pseudomonadota bacterium]
MHTPFFHFSVDDIFDSLIEITDAQLRLFEHPFFDFLHGLHQSYLISIDLYLFYHRIISSKKQRQLSEISTALKEEFLAVPWLRLGPHALAYDRPPYAQSPQEQQQTFDAIYQNIDRLGGNRSRWLRLHYFSEAYELAAYWQNQGVDTLLLTDKPAIAYRLAEQEKAQLAQHGVINYQGINLRRSHERIENLALLPSLSEVYTRLDKHIEKHGFLVLFSHEIDLMNPKLQMLTHQCLSHLIQQGLKHFP